MKKRLLLFALIISLINVGWFSTYKVDIRNVRNFYTTVKLKGAPEVLLSNLKDQRTNRKLIGQIGSLKFVPDIPVRDAFTDRIASRLKTNGFNIKKKQITSNQKKIARTLYKKHAISFITGDIFAFSFTGINSETKNVIGKSIFDIKVYDINGVNTFEKYYFVSVDSSITNTPLSDAENLIEELFNTSMDILFNDQEFTSSMGIVKLQDKKLKDYAYYDKNLSKEVNSLLLSFNSLKISKNEFLKRRDMIFNSF